MKRIFYKKNVGFIIGMYFLQVFSLLIVVMLIDDALQSTKEFSNNDDSISNILLMLYFLFITGVSVKFLLDFHFGYLETSEKYINVNCLSSGKKYIIPRDVIIAKNLVSMTVKGFTNNMIVFYLKNGKIVRSPFLFCKDADIKTVDNHFDFDGISSKRELKRKYDIDYSLTLEEMNVEIKSCKWIYLLRYIYVAVILLLIVLVIV